MSVFSHSFYRRQYFSAQSFFILVSRKYESLANSLSSILNKKVTKIFHISINKISACPRIHTWKRKSQVKYKVLRIPQSCLSGPQVRVFSKFRHSKKIELVDEFKWFMSTEKIIRLIHESDWTRDFWNAQSSNFDKHFKTDKVIVIPNNTWQWHFLYFQIKDATMFLIFFAPLPLPSFSSFSIISSLFMRLKRSYETKIERNRHCCMECYKTWKLKKEANCHNLFCVWGVLNSSVHSWTTVISILKLIHENNVS